MFRLLSAVCTITITASALSAGTPPQRLRELARAHAQNATGEPLMIPGPLGTPHPKAIAELTREAEAVFHGRLIRLQTYLGKDGERILTDYAIREERLLAGRTAKAVARARDFSKPLVVTALGGELVIEGVRVIQSPADERSIVDGGEYVLFLMPSRSSGDRYEVYNAGIFEVEKGRVRPLHSQSDTLFKDAFNASLETVLARVEKSRLF
jgi:hypothetical protein